MAVPTYDRFIEPLLRELAKHPSGISAATACEAVAAATQLSEADRAELLPSGRQAAFRNRIGWAHDRLKRDGRSTSLKRGVWALTTDGRKLVAEFPSKLPDEEIERIANCPRDGHISNVLFDVDADSPPTAHVVAPALTSQESPEERIESGLSEMRDSVARDLLTMIGQSSPLFFEILVLDLLHALGYGTSRADLTHVGGSGDGGIDGIISLDRLGLEKVYVQAKRWQGSVGSPVVQTFMGALQLQGASKGVLITTGAVTKDARDAASRSRGSIVLVDGARLTELMIEHGVAVTHRSVKVPKIDSDYFDETT